VIVYQCLFGAFNGALHGLQLLSDLSARSAFFDHFDDCFEVAIGTFQTSGNRRMRVVLPAGYRKSLDTVKGQAYVPIVVWNICSRQGFTLTTSILELHMGSTTFGNANPATMIGLTMPQDIKIDRDGCGRVRVVGRVFS
jgi:hypothetical protein